MYQDDTHFHNCHLTHSLLSSENDKPTNLPHGLLELGFNPFPVRSGVSSLKRAAEEK